MKIATFNVQNMRLRWHNGMPRLDGARDGDLEADIGEKAQRLDPIDRHLTAKVIRDMGADVVALQEVFDGATLDHFHDTCLLPSGTPPYDWRYCKPGNDGRGLDVALLSRQAPQAVQSHAALTCEDLDLLPVEGLGWDTPIFRRDCLMARINGLTLFICHFKAPYPDAAAVWPIRHLEAQAVRRLIERYFPIPQLEPWLILGDLNGPAHPVPDRGNALTPLLDGFSVDLLTRLPETERWSYHNAETGLYARPDAMLASPALASAFADACPTFIREGLGRETTRYTGARLPEVGEHRPHASDHAGLVIEFAGL